MLKNGLFARTQRRAISPRRRNFQPRRLMIEACEDRHLMAVLGVDIDRNEVREDIGDGAANATITRDVSDSELTIMLSSSDTSEISVQPSVTMAAGVPSVTVPLNAVDDTLLDGFQLATIRASAPGFTEGSDTILVRDIERLSLTLAQDSLAIGETTTATLARSNTDTESAVSVTIQHDKAADLVIPSEVEIPAGRQSVEIPVAIVDNGIVDGTRTFPLWAFSDGYFNGADFLEIREEGVTGVRVAADGYAVDDNQDESFVSVVTRGYSLEARDVAREHRALAEFDIRSIHGVVEAVSLTVRVQGYSARLDEGPVVELFGYAADGTLTSSDATAGRKIAEFQIPPMDGIGRYGVPLDTDWIQPLIGDADYVGISARVTNGYRASFTSSRNTFTHESNRPMLQFLLSSEPAPAAVDDAAATNEDTSVAIRVLDNDFGAGLSVIAAETPAHGTVVVNDDQTITYTPAANYYGTDRFTYTVRDENGDVDSAVVAVDIQPVNDPPMARNDRVTTPEDVAVTIDVLSNDTDVDGDSLSIDRVTRPSHGRVVVNDDQTITYTPFDDYHGSDSFVYSVTDGNGAYRRAFVNLEIQPVNDDPEVVDHVFEMEENAPEGFQLGRVDATDVDGDSLNFALRGADAAPFAVDPRSGALTVVDAALLDYETQPRFDFEVVVTDGAGGSAVGALTVQLQNVPEVVIDLLPKDPLNRLSPNGKFLEVAILGAPGRDPLQHIDLASLRLRSPGATDGAAVAEHPQHGYRSQQRDINGDGQTDLVLRFHKADLGLTPDETTLVLEGNLLPEFGGTSFSVEQAITLAGNRGKGGGSRRNS